MYQPGLMKRNLGMESLLTRGIVKRKICKREHLADIVLKSAIVYTADKNWLRFLHFLSSYEAFSMFI